METRRYIPFHAGLGPAAFFELNDSSYNTFKTSSANRTTMLLAGANDGMLHAIRESDGAELWAFIPPDVLDELKDLKVAIGKPHELLCRRKSHRC